MPRSKKDSRILNIKMASKVHDQLERFCEETGSTKTTAVEKILGQFLDEYFGRPDEERRIFKR